MLPLIGITMDEDRDYAGYRLRRDYCACVSAAGGLPLLLPHLPPDQAGPVLDLLAGLIVSGGGDYPPQYYGQGPAQPPTERDQWEWALLRGAWARGLPILGICRGCQGLNIALGGDLIPDLPSRGRYGPHDQSQPRWQASHGVRLLRPELQRCYGCSWLWVNSFHHQAVGRLAPALVLAAASPDGVAEAVLSPAPAPFAWGVQWHPEALRDMPPFRALAEAAGKYGGNKL